MNRQALIAIVIVVVAGLAAGGWYLFAPKPLPEVELDVVRLGVDVPYPPYEYRNQNGELTGFEIELGNAVCDHLEIECVWVTEPWDTIIPGLLEGRYDAIMSSMSINDERAQKVDFGEPYYSTPSVLFTRQSSGIESDSKSALEGRSVGVIADTIQESYMREEYDDAIQLKTYETNGDVTEAMRGGEVEVVFNDYPQWEQEFMVEGDYPVIGDPVQLGNGVGMAFRPEDDALRELFNRGLQAVKDDGTFTRLRKDYLFFEVIVD